MRKLTIAATLLLAACASGGREDDDVDPIGDNVGDWQASVAPQANFSVRGTAKAQSVGVGTGVNIAINGATPGSQHPWHVHRGRCGDNGPIVGSATAYPVLSVAPDGTSSANATISTALNERDTYYVNVHRSPSDLGTIVGCGNLSND